MRSSNPMFEFIDSLLLSNRKHYYTNREIIERYQGKPLANDAKQYENVKGNRYWNSVDAAFRKMKQILRDEHGTTFEFKNGRNASDGFRYPLHLDDPMKQHLTEHRQMRTKQLERLLRQSVGLLPGTWLADLLAGVQGISKDDGKIVSFDRNMQVRNLQWVPTVFDAIESQKVLSFQYRPRYADKIKDVLLHPYFLKEYNSSWFVFGYVTDKDGGTPESICCALDRIVGEILFAEDVEYVRPKKPGFASAFFKDIVGVTRFKGPAKLIQIETQDIYTHWRIKTKKLHPSQQELRPFTDVQNGLFTIKVIPNNELDTLLLSFGAHIKILEPQSYVDSFQEMVRKLNNLYFTDDKPREKKDVKSC